MEFSLFGSDPPIQPIDMIKIHIDTETRHTVFWGILAHLDPRKILKIFHHRSHQQSTATTHYNHQPLLHPTVVGRFRHQPNLKNSRFYFFNPSLSPFIIPSKVYHRNHKKCFGNDDIVNITLIGFFWQVPRYASLDSRIIHKKH